MRLKRYKMMFKEDPKFTSQGTSNPYPYIEQFLLKKTMG